MKMLPSAHSYENTFNTRFFWGAGQKLQKSFFQLENPFCVNAGSALDEFSIPLWSAFRQVWQQTASLLSSWCNHLNRQTMLFEMIFWWILTPEGLWNFSAGMDYLIRLLRLDLEGGVVALSFPVCQLSLWMAPNHFHFRVVLLFLFFDYTRLCVTGAWFHPR